jgi:hypothetical protein
MLTRIALLVGPVHCGYLAGRQGINAWYARQNSSDALENVLRPNPADPQSFDDFGMGVHVYADGGSRDKIIGSYEAATRLSPENAQYWSDLGAALRKLFVEMIRQATTPRDPVPSDVGEG